ncbi:MAG: PQQ-dependent dehydrogenase, methanol/ethanol family [Lewinella sp.]|nr:PQQ-dependent dehydrogenase, methanol/ethanol family [Lewinella sp.]
MRYAIIFSLLALLSLACEPELERVEEVAAGSWPLHGLDYAETRYSPLTQINADNVEDLGLAWSLDLGMKRGVEATPIVLDDIMYLTGPWSVVFAVDLRTHEFRWTYDPEVPKSYGERGCCDVVNRGVAVHDGKVYVGTFDGRLLALDADSGELIWEVLTVDPDQPYTITGAPRVVKDKVIIGNGGAEFGVRGYFTAYEAETGEEAWRFYTVPGDPARPFENAAMEKAAATWTGEWWKYGGGGTAWDAMAFDPELDLLYVGTGNGSPWDRSKRSPQGGDNLYLSSILALDPDDGTLSWYYQTTPGDSWDFTATQHMILADLEIEGQLRKVLMQAPKNGFFYVLDRTNGELISAETITYVNWADSIDLATGRPVETPWARYDRANVDIAPNYNGAHNWQPMAFDEQRGQVYIPARETFSNYGQDSTWVYNEAGFGTGIGWNLAIGSRAANPTLNDEKARNQGKLIAWDPVRQQAVWEVEQDNIWNGGLLATAGGLVFQGTADGRLTAYDAATGELIWEESLHTGIMAPPITYLVDGVQYLTVVTGWGGGYGMKNKHTDVILPGTIYTFSLDGTAPLPEAPTAYARELIKPEWTIDPARAVAGDALFGQYCGPCHVVAETGGGVAPDLGYSALVGNEAFSQVVLEGILLPNGMPRFDDRLSPAQVEDLQHYIVQQVAMARQAEGE